MDIETLKKSKELYDKLVSLKDNRYKLITAKSIIDINILLYIDTGECSFTKVGIKYLNSNKLKSFLLEEISKEIVKTQKEFDEL